MFILGFLIGLVFSILNLVIYQICKDPIEQRIEVINNKIQEKSFKKKGYLIEPESDADELRKSIIKRNQKRGIPTKVKDLI